MFTYFKDMLNSKIIKLNNSYSDITTYLCWCYVIIISIIEEIPVQVMRLL